MNNPKCTCGEESVFVDNGPRLQYHYCKNCKVEVKEEEKTLDIDWPTLEELSKYTYSIMDDLSYIPKFFSEYSDT